MKTKQETTKIEIPTGYLERAGININNLLIELQHDGAGAKIILKKKDEDCNCNSNE